MTSPLPPSSQGEGYEESLATVIGTRVTGVRYLIPEGTQWPDGRADGFVHEVDHGVELMLSSTRSLRMQWEMDGENEYLGASLIPSVREAGASNLIQAVDASTAPEWTPILGGTISSVRVSLHIPNTGCPKSAWAIRFDTEAAVSFVVALGEIRDGVPEYLPDGVLVIFDREDAESYRTAGSSTSAWDGEIIH